MKLGKQEANSASQLRRKTSFANSSLSSNLLEINLWMKKKNKLVENIRSTKRRCKTEKKCGEENVE
ncbi:CLUMA_CG015553, isoform A [Clunio marinus]|uniref:CLUMA_CG015553, isoform A n=1 Tax=Clunio marinus TaxID=568069 RepID=A0A1J1IPW5_9DIPT|nr:CLUMA_CG015553, isoform A [Clunio marinus]